MVLNGWQRLFVVLLIIWSFCCIGIGIWALSERRDFGVLHEFCSLIKANTPPENMLLYYQFVGNAPVKDLSLSSVTYIAATKLAIPGKQIDTLQRSAYQEYDGGRAQSDRKEIVTVMTIFWAVCAALVYGIGLVCAWVTKGFRPTPATTARVK